MQPAAARSPNTPAANLSCALLIHSTDRPAARAFWEESLVTADLHWPHDVCQGAWYFSYDRDTLGQLPPILARLRHRPRLIRRAIDTQWVEAMRADLRAIRERYVFHVMDDSVIPDALPARAVRSVVELAASLNAAVLGLSPSMLPFWREDRAVVRLRWPLAGEGVSVLHASPHTRYVAQQGFSLWETAALLRTLTDPPFGTGAVGNSHRDWELGWNEWRSGRETNLAPPARLWARRTVIPNRTRGVDAVARRVASSVAAADLRHRAYALDLGSGAPAVLRALHGVLDAGHGGQIKGGLCACAWIRAVTSSLPSLMEGEVSAEAIAAAGDRHSRRAMGLPLDTSSSHATVRNGTGWLKDPSYAFCRAPSQLLFADLERSGCACDGTVCRRCWCGKHQPAEVPRGTRGPPVGPRLFGASSAEIRHRTVNSKQVRPPSNPRRQKTQNVVQNSYQYS